MTAFATYPPLEYRMMFLLHIRQDTFRKTSTGKGLDYYSFLSDTYELSQLLQLLLYLSYPYLSYT
jgi:hypothetical protein